MKDESRSVFFILHPSSFRKGWTYLAFSAAASPCFLRLSQLYLRWNFSTRPVVSTYFILPVKKGWHAEQISTVMFLRVLRVTNLLPHPQTTVASTYSGWIPVFMYDPFSSLVGRNRKQLIIETIAETGQGVAIAR